MPMRSRQLSELVQRAAAASAERGEAAEPPPPAPVARPRALPSLGPEGVGKKAPIASTLRLSRPGLGSVALQASAEGAAASAPAEALADERRERRDRRLARHGLTMADITAVTWRLMERWPAVFGEHRRALAVGIHHAILAEMPDCDRTALSFALRQWCSHPAYLRALATGRRHRHSLAGEDVADITAGDRAWARQQLQELRQQRAARQPSVSGGLR